MHLPGSRRNVNRLFTWDLDMSFAVDLRFGHSPLGHDSKIDLVFTAGDSHSKSRPVSPLMSLADSLELGKSLFVSKDEWTATGFQSEPSQLVQNSSHHPRGRLRGKRFATEKPEDGWRITIKA